MYERDLRMVVENPANGNFLLFQQNFVEPPTFIDKDRTKRGDVFKKPTAYWIVNIKPHTHTHTHKKKRQKAKFAQYTTPQARSALDYAARRAVWFRKITPVILYAILYLENDKRLRI